MLFNVGDVIDYGGRRYNTANRDERIALIGSVIENGGITDPSVLERLADAILYEELTDPNPYKIAQTEYPFFSESQLNYRYEREVSLWAAENVGVDGADHRPNKRRRRSKRENAFMDRGIRVKNAERKAQYRRDTSPGPIVSYNVKERELTEAFVMAAQQGGRWRELAGRYRYADG